MCRPPQIKLNSEARFKSTQKEITPRHSFRPAQTTHSKDLPYTNVSLQENRSRHHFNAPLRFKPLILINNKTKISRAGDPYSQVICISGYGENFSFLPACLFSQKKSIRESILFKTENKWPVTCFITCTSCP